MTRAATQSEPLPQAPAESAGANGHGGLSVDNAFRAFIRTYGLLERVMHPFFARFGISGAQWGVFRSLQRAEAEGREALSVTELSERLLIRPPSVTSVIDRMVRDDYVSRRALPTDMRVKQIRLTAKGRELVARVSVGLDEQVQRTLAGLTADEQVELQRLLAVMGRHLESLIIRLAL
jgi:DNA-binding MarR family transcriptional regulator